MSVVADVLLAQRNVLYRFESRGDGKWLVGRVWDGASWVAWRLAGYDGEDEPRGFFVTCLLFAIDVLLAHGERRRHLIENPDRIYSEAAFDAVRYCRERLVCDERRRDAFCDAVEAAVAINAGL